jgi:adenylate cyclase class IV
MRPEAPVLTELAMQNLEQKFRCGDLAGAENAARSLGAADRGVFRQQDFFFSAAQARLKLRIINGSEAGELIAYRRADAVAARTSDYLITPVANAASLLATLTHALGRPRELVKTRHLFIYGSTRIHIDNVEDAGGFVELEGLLAQRSPEEARAELETIAAALNLREAVSVAYVDLKKAGEPEANVG